MWLWLTFANAETNSQNEDEVEVGFRGSWQTKRFTDGSALVQQGIHLRISKQWNGATAYVDFMDARVWGSEETYKTNKDQMANLYEGYVRLPIGSVGSVQHSLTVGKQEVVVNDERFLSKGSWGLYGRTFNAATIRGEWDTGFWQGGMIQLRNGGVYTSTCSGSTCDIVSHGDLLWYWNGKAEFNEWSIQPYYLHQRENPTEADLSIHRRINSPGLRINGQINNLFTNIEGAYQFGKASKSIDHKAWMGVGELGYKKDRFSSSLYVEHNSGDDDLQDNVDRDFESFLGRYHGLRGWSDQVGGTNLRDIAFKIRVPVSKKRSGILHLHQFQMDKTNGNLYAFNKEKLGSSPNNTESNLGKEVDVVFLQKPMKGVSVKWAHSVFFPEGAKVAYAGQDPIHFTYIWMVVDR